VSESPHPGSALRNLNGIGGFCQEMNKRVLSQSNSALNSVALRLRSRLKKSHCQKRY
jgi:hypothetical protein